jgi:pimeloyl-ACP methyl ester carboxylesterase
LQQQIPGLAAACFATVVLIAPPVLAQGGGGPDVERRDRPVTNADLFILRRAGELLANESRWNRKDTRVCKPDAATWSLFCALHDASTYVLGEYQHRRVALQEVRFVIEEAAEKSKLGGHRLMGFNNLAETSFADVKNVLATATGRVEARLAAVVTRPQQRVSFPTEDGGVVHADLYGKGRRAVVLAHGGRFNRASWEPQAHALARAGFRVLAIDFRGRGQSRGGPRASESDPGYRFDVLASVRYLRRTGAKTVSVVGASFGGGAAAEAAVAAVPGEIDSLVLLAAGIDDKPELVKGRKLFIVTRDDRPGEGPPRLVHIRQHYQRTPEPKQLVVLDGSAHAQLIFDTSQGERTMREILRFLSGR